MKIIKNDKSSKVNARPQLPRVMLVWWAQNLHFRFVISSSPQPLHTSYTVHLLRGWCTRTVQVLSYHNVKKTLLGRSPVWEGKFKNTSVSVSLLFFFFLWLITLFSLFDTSSIYSHQGQGQVLNSHLLVTDSPFFLPASQTFITFGFWVVFFAKGE